MGETTALKGYSLAAETVPHRLKLTQAKVDGRYNSQNFTQNQALRAAQQERREHGPPFSPTCFTTRAEILRYSWIVRTLHIVPDRKWEMHSAEPCSCCKCPCGSTGARPSRGCWQCSGCSRKNFCVTSKVSRMHTAQRCAHGLRTPVHLIGTI